jgi:hypothetical protein
MVYSSASASAPTHLNLANQRRAPRAPQALMLEGPLLFAGRFPMRAVILSVALLAGTAFVAGAPTAHAQYGAYPGPAPYAGRDSGYGPSPYACAYGSSSSLNVYASSAASPDDADRSAPGYASDSSYRGYGGLPYAIDAPYGRYSGTSPFYGSGGSAYSYAGYGAAPYGLSGPGASPYGCAGYSGAPYGLSHDRPLLCTSSQWGQPMLVPSRYSGYGTTVLAGSSDQPSGSVTMGYSSCASYSR